MGTNFRKSSRWSPKIKSLTFFKGMLVSRLSVVWQQVQERNPELMNCWGTENSAPRFRPFILSDLNKHVGAESKQFEHRRVQSDSAKNRKASRGQQEVRQTKNLQAETVWGHLDRARTVILITNTTGHRSEEAIRKSNFIQIGPFSQIRAAVDWLGFMFLDFKTDLWWKNELWAKHNLKHLQMNSLTADY